jgi:hypothetical protein
MDIIRSTVQGSSQISGSRVDREVVIEVHDFTVAQARQDAIQRFSREHPEATVEAIAHAVIARPTSGRTWSKYGTYHVTLRATGLLEDLTPREAK